MASTVIAFRRMLAHPKLTKLPFILENPAVEEGDDRRNMDTLKKLSPKPSEGPFR